MPVTYKEYRRELIRKQWAYTSEEFAGAEAIFDRATPTQDRPPVFEKSSASQNIITPTGLGPSIARSLRQMIPPKKRHRWFRSMSSSQALAQSVFGALSVMGKEYLLEGLETEEGDKPFVAGQAGRPTIELEVGVDHLGEPRPTSLDVAFRGARLVGIEVKLTEQKVGSCSRPRLKPDDPQHCDGNYTRQSSRLSRCSLTEIGVRYWEHIPKLYRIDPGIDHVVCPLDETYQLVRNVLGVCILRDGSLSPDGQVVLLCDDRNPAFLPGGPGDRAYAKVREALLQTWRLQRCSWQKLVGILRSDGELTPLTEHLSRKYGF